MTLGLLGKQWFYFCFVLGNCSGNTVKVCMFHGSDCKTVVCPTITVSHSLFAHWKKRCGWFDEANANHDWLDCIVKQGGCLLVSKGENIPPHPASNRRLIISLSSSMIYYMSYYYFFQVSLLTSAAGGQHHPLKYIETTDETTGSV